MKRRLTMIAVMAVVWVARLSMQPEAQAVAPPAPKTPPAAPLAQAAGAKATTPRAMELADILAWKSADETLLSTDGRWLANRSLPLDGDSEIVVKQNAGRKGSTPLPRGRRPRDSRADGDFRGREVGGVQRGADEEGGGPAPENAPARAEQGDDPPLGRRVDDDRREDPAVRLLGREGDVDRDEGIRGRCTGGRWSRGAAARRAGGAAAASSAMDDRPKGGDLHPPRACHRGGAERRQRERVCLRQERPVPGLRHRRHRQARQRRRPARPAVRRDFTARYRQGHLRAPGMDGEGRRARRAEGDRGQWVQGQGLRGDRVHEVRAGQAREDCRRPVDRQDVPRGDGDRAPNRTPSGPRTCRRSTSASER